MPADVEQALRQMPGWADAELRITPIHTGITNRNYRVDVDGQQYVARLPGERTEVLGIDRSCEAEAATRAAELGIAPGIRGPLPGYTTLVTDYVDATPAREGELARDGTLQDLVVALATFHRSGEISGQFPIHRVVEWHARDAVAEGVRVPAEFEQLHRCSAEIEAAFGTHPMAPAPCHNDLLPANILLNEQRLWLIDFEYAGMNDAYFDLGNLSVNAGFDQGTDERLLVAYTGAVTAARWARLQLMKVMSELREGMWAVVQQGISTLDTIDFVAYAAERLDSCRQLADGPDFGRWLADAAHPV